MYNDISKNLKMSISFKCQFCDRYCSSWQGYAWHVNNCIKALEAQVILIDDNVENTEPDEELEDEEEPDEQELEEPDNFDELHNYSDNFDEPEDELDNQIQNYSYNFEDELEDEPEELKDESEDKPKDKSMKLKNETKKESEMNNFPNDTYTDLMNLVINHNLNNKAGNAIIRFFNKYSNLSVSPLPKNIESGRKFMDKISNKLSQYHKQLMLEYNNVEYFLYYRPIKNCIQKLLSNSELSRLLLYKYESLRVNIINALGIFLIYYLYCILHLY